jgi:hypothetical protein
MLGVVSRNLRGKPEMRLPVSSIRLRLGWDFHVGLVIKVTCAAG